MMKTIQLTQGQEALVDDEDFERVNAFKWYAHHGLHKGKRENTYYAWRNTLPNPTTGKRGTESMHVFISGIKDVDHIDGNGLNNQHCNLRQATRSQQIANTRPRQGCSSQYKGVDKKGSKWRAKIVVKGKAKHLGMFISEMEAAEAYDKAAREIFREFSKTNFLGAE